MHTCKVSAASNKGSLSSCISLQNANGSPFIITINAFKAAGMEAGVALNPHTPVAMLESIIHDIDLVLIMSVNPGFGGQSFIKSTYYKVKLATDLIKEKNADVIIEVDGGVNTQNAPKLRAAGAHALVAGSAVFKSENPQQTIKELKGVS